MGRLFSRLGTLRVADDGGKASRAFSLYHQKHCEELERQFGDIRDQLALVQAAQATADAVKRNDAIGSSFTKPGLVATAADAGSNVTITISNHQRFYGDSASVNVTGAPITGIPYSASSGTQDKVAVFYDDLARAGGAVVYQHTTNLVTAQNNYVPGRHYVATVDIPIAGGAPSQGGTAPSGSGYRTDPTVPGTDLP